MHGKLLGHRVEFLETRQVIIAIEKNKPAAIAELSRIAASVSQPEKQVLVKSLPARYPQGAEKVLIAACTGRQVPPGKLPADVGCVVMNVTSVAFLARYLKTGMPLVEKRLTVDGSAIAHPKNVQVAIGTPVGEVIAFCGGTRFKVRKLLMGGPMMGLALMDDTMPVLKHYKGVCHAFVDADADLDKALDIVFNGKVQRPGVCNALECLLVHKDCAAAFLPRVGRRLGEAGVEFRACPASLPLLGPTAKAQSPDDLGQEFHALILAVRVVDDMDAALAHIARYGSNHTEIICTNDHEHAMRFLREADASMVAVNASTRFNDGGQLGLGAEIGISTSKLHAYGPMGVQELTTTKFVVFGQGQVRQ